MNKSSVGWVPTGKSGYFSIEMPQAQSIISPGVNGRHFFWSTSIIILHAVQLEFCFSALFV